MVLYNKELDFQGNRAERFPLPTGSSACAGLPVPLSQPPQSTREHYLLPTLERCPVFSSLYKVAPFQIQIMSHLFFKILQSLPSHPPMFSC